MSVFISGKEILPRLDEDELKVLYGVGFDFVRKTCLTAAQNRK
jgi:hypothetical protein